MARGGYQKPNNPAPVSGPGALSRRTDGGPTQGAKYMSGGQYGEGQALLAMQQSAPMASKPSITVPKGSPVSNLPPLTELTAPTERPNEAFSTGMPFDDTTPGPSVLGFNQQKTTITQTLAEIAQYDPTGETNELLNYLAARGF